MKLLLITLTSLLAAAHAGIIGAGYQGPGASATVVGPDGSSIGSVAVGGAVAPGLVGIGHGVGVVGPIGLGGLGGHVGLVGSGIEGQYVPSGLERLYDDGSYRLEHHLEGSHLILH